MRHTQTGFDFAWLLLIMLAWGVWLPWSAVHLDFARDLALAADIVDGSHYPLSGPLLAGWAKLGPLWYYFLALLLWIGQDYLGVVLLLGLMASSQFVLVYLAGREWAGREAGLLWAALWLLPSWTLYDSFLVSHTLLAPPLVALAVLSGIRWIRHQHAVDLYVLALACSLALHAHPSTLALMPLAALVAAVGGRQRLQVGVWTVALMLAILPFVPMLWEQWQSDWPLLAGAREYRASAEGQGSMASIPMLFWQIGFGGMAYWLERLLDWPPGGVVTALAVNAVLITLALIGLLLRIRAGHRTELYACLGFGLALVVLSLLRAIYPYWFLGGIRMLWLGLIAVGLSALLSRSRSPSRYLACIIMASGLLHVAISKAAIVAQQQGAWPFAVFPAFDVTHPAEPHRAMPFLSVYAARESGHWLCQHPNQAMHGPLAQSLAMSYAIQRRLQCGDGPVYLGGQRPDRAHWAGLPMHMLQTLQLEPSHVWMGWGLVRVQPLWAHGEMTLPGQRLYPYLPLPTAPAAVIEIDVAQAEDQILVMTHLGFLLSERPRPELYCDQKRILPLDSDMLTDAFKLPPCPVAFTLRFSLAEPSHVSLFVVDD